MAPSSDKKDKVSSDPRFANIQNDPKFRKTKLSKFKIKLDDRFSKEDLNLSHKKGKRFDKYGRRIEDDNLVEKKDFDKYFEKDDDKRDDDSEKIGDQINTVDRARGEVPSDYMSSSDEVSSSESDDDADSFMDDDDDDESEIELEESKPDECEPTKTIACVNMDWDHIRAADLMITFNSFVPKGGKIIKVVIYPSEFGRERMQREEVEGPPRELFKKKKNHSKKDREDNEDIDIKDLYDEGDADEDYDIKTLRRYQLERLRYYYAIVYCNNVATAKAICDNCDHTEYEASSNMFDLRYVPDDMVFDNDTAKDECSEITKNYKPLDFTTDALQHSKVKLTWDETPAARVELAKRAFTQREIEDMDFKAYLASDTDSSDGESTKIDEEAKNKLKSLVSSVAKVGDKNIFENKNNKDSEKDDDVDMEITFEPALGGEANNNGDKKEKDVDHEEEEESTIEKFKRREKERRKLRKNKIKELKKQDHEKKKSLLKTKDEVSDDNQQKKNAAELELLMLEANDTIDKNPNKKAHFHMNEIIKSEKEKGKKSKYQKKDKIIEDDFKPDLNDPRFKEIFEDHDFAIDPTQPEFKGTKAMKTILEERSNRTNKNTSKNKKNSMKNSSKNYKMKVNGDNKDKPKDYKNRNKKRKINESSSGLTDLVNKVKQKYQKK
ncbi:pre-rRNA-processing protein ESF1 SCDLUD_003211 [Saccharomycodes ludwigii]|uniref:pre-rRNA-processing protein ESF1 n=1 Tax=Saccharomycodes ludwigii TaxID=36035 RepID=UPI001E8B8373|nr:hypothetical protein SCDLUD_003211 [Saccharomycodes ludwigii]KAH3900240.1 hypothetical protein SCDLUD_003211 [Saccharomycodes ludwigii]